MTNHSAFIGVDVGGTFTDLVSIDESGRITAEKVASTPGDQSEGVMNALRLVSHNVSRFVHGTTVATNMLLERSGARVVLVATDGFTDILFLARQDRASLYDLSQHQPAPLVARDHVIAARERITPEGVTLALSNDELQRITDEVATRSPAIVVVALLHSYADPSHEHLIRDALLRSNSALEVVLSSDVFPEIREYERTATAVAEGYLRPGVGRYIARLTARAEDLNVPAPGVMTSGGGMRTPIEAAANAASLSLSGPAGGIVGAAAVLRAARFTEALTVDIGGTSADVGVIVGGEPLIERGGRIAGVPIALPRVLIETVSAGGGSIGWIDDGGALRVGPRSAGASPGPAAFGKGGALPTVTDAHVVLGHITASALSGGITLDREAARSAIGDLARQLNASHERVAHAMIVIADASVARALRRVSVERGINPRDCILVPFGGGGPLHACGLAEQLGMSSVFVPPHAGVLSALGLAITSERREHIRSVLREAGAMTVSDVRALLAGASSTPPAGNGEWSLQHVARSRYKGQGFELDVPIADVDDGAALTERFHSLHKARNGFTLELPVEIVGLRHIRSGRSHPAAFASDNNESSSAPIVGPAIIMLPGATLRVSEGWTAEPHATGGWLVSR